MTIFEMDAIQLLWRSWKEMKDHLAKDFIGIQLITYMNWAVLSRKIHSSCIGGVCNNVRFFRFLWRHFLAIYENFVATQRAFRTHFNFALHATVPNNRSFSKWVENFCERGNVLPKKFVQTCSNFCATRECQSCPSIRRGNSRTFKDFESKHLNSCILAFEQA